MKILVVTSYTKGIILPFVKEQMDAIQQNYSVQFYYFFIKKKGLWGYFQEWVRFIKFINENGNNYNAIHAHYGLSGLVASLQFKLKTIVTFHGSDINKVFHRILSQIAIFFSDHSIFVTKELKEKAIAKKYSIIPCGISMEYDLIQKDIARNKLGWEINKEYILFSSTFKREEKNAELAFKIIEDLKIDFPHIELVELDGYSRQEVNYLMCASDILLLTSTREGSPQVIKEAVYFKLPIVSTDVGNIKNILSGIDTTYVTQIKKEPLVHAVKKILNSGSPRIKNNSKIKQYDNQIIAKKVYEVYKSVLNEHTHRY